MQHYGPHNTLILYQQLRQKQKNNKNGTVGASLINTRDPAQFNTLPPINHSNNILQLNKQAKQTNTYVTNMMHLINPIDRTPTQMPYYKTVYSMIYTNLVFSITIKRSSMQNQSTQVYCYCDLPDTVLRNRPL